MPTTKKTKAKPAKKSAEETQIQATAVESQENSKAISTKRIKSGTPIPSIQATVMVGSRDADEGAADETIVSPSRRYYQRLTRFNPIRNLQPARLAGYIDKFKNGYLREFALLMDAIEHRDDVLSSVVPKRKSSVKRLKWQIVINEDIPDGMKEEAEKHKEALYYFYNNLSAGDATDANVNAGWATFLDHVLDAVGHFYSAQEIIWKPSPEGLTARFNKMPLWFFENKTGKLKFLPTDYAVDGEDLEDRAWLIACGDGLLEPCACAYMFKNLSFKDWVSYNEKHGTPGVHGETTAPIDSPAWNALKDAVAAISQNFSCVTGAGDKINKLDFSAQGQLPYAPLVQEMNERMSTIWRGGSMSTMAKQTGPEQSGVGLQEDEEHKLTCSDGAFVTETLNIQIDPIVIEWAFGAGVKPLANVKVAPPTSVDVDRDMKVFDFAKKYGVQLGKRQIQEHFSISEMDEEDEPVDDPMAAMLGEGDDDEEEDFGFDRNAEEDFGANETLSPEIDAKLLNASRSGVARMTAVALAPIRERLEAIMDMPNEQAMTVALMKFREDAPKMLAEINRNPANADALNDVLVAGWFNGLLSAETIRY